MLRWLGVLILLSAIAGSLAFGLVPTHAAGLARLLFDVFVGLLAASLVVGIVRPG